MPFAPFDYGQVMGQAEGIKGQRAQNALLQQRQADIERQNALMANPATTPEQFTRGGMPGIGQTLQGGRDEALANLGGVARNILQLPPQMRRGAATQVLQSPQYVAAFQSLGVDPASLNIASLPDEAIEQELQQLAAHGQPQESQFSPSRFRSPQVTSSGRLIVQDGATGQSIYSDTGQPWDSRADPISADAKLVTLPDGSVQLVDTRMGPPGTGPRPTVPVVTPETAVSGAAARAGAEAGARAEAEATAEQQQDLTANQRMLEVWSVAKQGLINALAGTDTGPIAGRIPAVTSGQQIAEGAVAAVAPVLKQLFRTAGEGTFTDRDQQLLLEMVPARTDLPETAAAKIAMIDAIIQAKLAASVPGGDGQPPVAPQGPVSIATDAEYDQLPSGTVFVGPDGVQRTKP